MHAQQYLQAAISAFSQGEPERAAQLARQVLQLVAEQPDALHLLALCARSLGQTDDALNCFKRSLSANPAQSVVWSNYGNLLQQLEHLDAAEQAYQRALTLAPQQADTWLNAGLLALRRQRPTLAQERLQQALQLRPDDSRIYSALANAAQQLQQTDKALALLAAGLERWPAQPQLVLQQVRLLRDSQQPVAATAIVQQQLAQMPTDAELHFTLGCLHYDLGENKAAEQALLQAISLQPLHIAAHEALNQLYWEAPDHPQFLQVTRQILATQPNALALRYCAVTLLLQSGNDTDAAYLLHEGLQIHGPVPELLHALGVQADKRGDLAQALALNSQALAQPQLAVALKVRLLTDAGVYHLKQHALSAAEQKLLQAQTLAPTDQEIWAHLGTCWRLQGNPKAHWLNDYATLIDARPLPTPAGYQNLAEFLAELVPVIRQLHTNSRQPLDQSVRGGTQTLGRLLAEPHPLIQLLKTALEQRINEYLQRLPSDVHHPLLSRNHGQFRFSGSWSVQLGQHGFHTNHVHPQGWLSACTYLELPQSVQQDDPQRQGWLKLGETSLGLGTHDVVAQAICPTPGLVVLFPSFVWHGTYPFISPTNEHRLTAPCDIMPA